MTIMMVFLPLQSPQATSWYKLPYLRKCHSKCPALSIFSAKLGVVCFQRPLGLCEVWHLALLLLNLIAHFLGILLQRHQSQAFVADIFIASSLLVHPVLQLHLTPRIARVQLLILSSSLVDIRAHFPRSLVALLLFRLKSPESLRLQRWCCCHMVCNRRLFSIDLNTDTETAMGPKELYRIITIVVICGKKDCGCCSCIFSPMTKDCNFNSVPSNR